MIEGIWALTSGEQDGQDITEGDLNKSKLEIVGDQHTVTLGDVILKGTHKLDSSQSPMTIDVSDTDGPFAGKSMKGIFKLEDDVFTICIAASGEERPMQFSTKDGKATLLHVWKRQD